MDDDDILTPIEWTLWLLLALMILGSGAVITVGCAPALPPPADYSDQIFDRDTDRDSSDTDQQAT